MEFLYYELADGEYYVRPYYESCDDDYSCDYYVRNCIRIFVENNDQVQIIAPNIVLTENDLIFNKEEFFWIKMRAIPIPPYVIVDPI